MLQGWRRAFCCWYAWPLRLLGAPYFLLQFSDPVFCGYAGLGGLTVGLQVSVPALDPTSVAALFPADVQSQHRAAAPEVSVGGLNDVDGSVGPINQGVAGQALPVVLVAGGVETPVFLRSVLLVTDPLSLFVLAAGGG